jgi:CheY-like chemotaxis protein
VVDEFGKPVGVFAVVTETTERVLVDRRIAAEQERQQHLFGQMPGFIIDDEPTVRMLMREVLEETGYIVLEAVDGPSGLRILRTDVRIDMLVTDVGLPGGMNGLQVADAARVSRSELRYLFVTGYAENAVVGYGLSRSACT